MPFVAFDVDRQARKSLRSTLVATFFMLLAFAPCLAGMAGRSETAMRIAGVIALLWAPLCFYLAVRFSRAAAPRGEPHFLSMEGGRWRLRIPSPDAGGAEYHDVELPDDGVRAIPTKEAIELLRGKEVLRMPRQLLAWDGPVDAPPTTFGGLGDEIPLRYHDGHLLVGDESVELQAAPPRDWERAGTVAPMVARDPETTFRWTEDQFEGARLLVEGVEVEVARRREVRRVGSQTSVHHSVEVHAPVSTDVQLEVALSTSVGDDPEAPRTGDASFDGVFSVSGTESGRALLGSRRLRSALATLGGGLTIEGGRAVLKIDGAAPDGQTVEAALLVIEELVEGAPA